MGKSLPYTFAAALSRPGSAHEGIEDRFTILDARNPVVRGARRGAIFAVADGVSSTDRADEAAEVACDHLEAFFKANRPASEDLLLDVIEASDAEVRMLNYGASTLAGIWVAQDAVRVFSLGDSSVYRVRGRELVRLNWKNPKQALHTYIGMGSNVRPAVELFTHEVRVGDIYLLMTDGVFAVFKEAELVSALVSTQDLIDFVAAIEHRVDRAKPADDVTLLAVQVLGLEVNDQDLEVYVDLDLDD